MLAELLDAVRAGAASGNDATLRAAWDSELVVTRLLTAIAFAARNGAAGEAARVAAWRVVSVHRGGATCTCGPVPRVYASPCPACCEAIRAVVPCPTWEELNTCRS